MAHLALLTTSYPDQKPGSEAAGSFVADFALELSRHIQISVLSPGSETGIESGNDLSIHRFAVPRIPLSLLRATNPGHWRAILTTIQAGEKALQQLLDNSHVDHILALWALPSGYWARNAWKQHNIPYSTWALGSDIWILGKIPGVRQYLARVLQDSSRCFADGHQLIKDVERISSCKCEFLPSIRNLPLREKNYRPHPPYRLAYLGRWHTNKGVDLFIEAIAHLSNTEWKAIEEIRICGGGPLESLVRGKCRKLQAAGRPLDLEGYLDKGQAADLLAWADYLIIPSRIESIPVIFYDAMQIGCPIIATPVGDLPKLLEKHQTGLLTADVSSKAIRDALASALQISPGSFSGALDKAARSFSVASTCRELIAALSLKI